jgi:coniferyl-aldehyde dehydrogenase
LAAAIRQFAGGHLHDLLVPLIRDPDPAVAAEALNSLEAIGEFDVLFVPPLVGLLRDRRHKARAREILVGYGEPVIFAPILPVVPYGRLDDAIAYVNAWPRPLALYYFDENRGRQDAVLAQTMSGGVTVNDCIYHLGQLDLPFGGVGPSGMGQYHGFDGFATFSKKRGVMVQRRWAGTALFRPPWRRRHGMIGALLRFVRR